MNRRLRTGVWTLLLVMVGAAAAGAPLFEETAPPVWTPPLLAPSDTGSALDFDTASQEPATAEAPEAGIEPEYWKAQQAAWDEAPGPGGTAGEGASGGFDDSFLRDFLTAMGWLCALCACIILGGAMLRKYARRTPLLAGQRLGTVMGKVHLSPRHALHFVRTGSRILVLGVTQGTITLLTEFDAAAFEASLEEVEVKEEAVSPGGFLAQLRASAGGLQQSAPTPDEDLASLRSDIQRLHTFLQEGSRESKD